MRKKRNSELQRKKLPKPKRKRRKLLLRSKVRRIAIRVAFKL